jgi:hypothetical protein
MNDSSRVDPSSPRWEELGRCPECREPMKQENATGERLGLYYRCAVHGRFRYSWDHDRLEAVGDQE